MYLPQSKTLRTIRRELAQAASSVRGKMAYGAILQSQTLRTHLRKLKQATQSIERGSAQTLRRTNFRQRVDAATKNTAALTSLVTLIPVFGPIGGITATGVAVCAAVGTAAAFLEKSK